MHFSPNSVRDYDWNNPEPVLSTWRDWLENYPALTGEAELFDPSAYIPGGLECEKHACRLHHRWWFSCMPHVCGVTSDGYSDSWWDYFASLDYVEAIRAEEDGSFTFRYRSGKTESFRPDPLPPGENRIETCSGPECAVHYSESEVTVYMDGKSASLPRT